MAIRLKELVKQPDLLTGGHRACAGCTAPSAIRQALMVAGPDTVVGFATGCMEVVTTIYPYSAWRVPYIHSAFENSAATVSGAEAAYRSLKRKGKITKDINFIAFGGDGGTYDIGLQSLSGALERGHKMLYICYDNEAYMNTGIQRSGATPFGAATSTTPAGTKIPGKMQQRKRLTDIVAAHSIPYLAQSTPYHYMDFMNKVEKALAADGPSFINVLAPCHRGWRSEMADAMEIARIAVDTCFWPLFEVVDGEYKMTYKPKEKLPLVEWLKLQGRFKHLFKPENAEMLETSQKMVDKEWNDLLKRCGEA